MKPEKLQQYVSGTRVASTAFFILALLALLDSVINQVHASILAGKLAILVNVGGIFLTYFVRQNISVKNYSYLTIALVMFAFTYYACFFVLISNLDQQVTNPLGIGSGKAIDYQFLGPTFFVIASTLFLRKKILIISICFYSLITILDLYKLMETGALYITNDWFELLNDPNAVNRQWLSFSILIYIFTCILSYTLVHLLDTMTTKVVNFERSNNQLSRYFSPSIREKIQQEENELQDLTDSNQLVAVLFTDIVGFTTLSEKLTPHETLELLSEYQDRMIKPIFKNLGTVDKFIGDAVMATFGTPTSQGNDAQNAFNCAREMQISMREWEKERTDLDLPVISHRIGIHFGACVVGNVGNDERKEFTVIGDVVNVASRVCEACKELQAGLIITEDVKIRLNEKVLGEEHDNFKIRGKLETLKLFKIET